LLVESGVRPVGGILGAGCEITWPRPLRPGDTIRLHSEILEVRSSKSKPGMGIVRICTTTLNQADEAVQVLIANLMVPKRAV
jgi:acyl dehydratase